MTSKFEGTLVGDGDKASYCFYQSASGIGTPIPSASSLSLANYLLTFLLFLPPPESTVGDLLMGLCIPLLAILAKLIDARFISVEI